MIILFLYSENQSQRYLHCLCLQPTHEQLSVPLFLTWERLYTIHSPLFEDEKGHFPDFTNAAISLHFNCSVLTLGFAVNVFCHVFNWNCVIANLYFFPLSETKLFFFCLIFLEKLGIIMLQLLLLFIIKGKLNAVQCIYLSTALLSSCSVDAPCHLNYVTALG